MEIALERIVNDVTVEFSCRMLICCTVSTVNHYIAINFTGQLKNGYSG